MITEEEAARIMAIVQYPSFEGTTYNPNYVYRLDEAFGNRGYCFGDQPIPFWQAAAWRAGREMHMVHGLIQMLAALRGKIFRDNDVRSRLSDVWFKEKK